MEKLARFGILVLLYVLSFVIVYTLLPAVVWIFGGSFKEVAQSVPYALFGIMFINLFLGVIFSQRFDTNFKSKR